MNLGELTSQIKANFHDPSYFDYITIWLNESVRELSYEFDLPALRLKLPATLATTTSNWQYLLSAATPPVVGYDYQKYVFKVTNSAHERGILPIHRDIQVIDHIDPDHDDTGNDVDRIAIEDETDDATIAIYPMANDTLNLWWYRKPIDMALTTDVPDGIPEAFHLRVLLPMALLRAFRVYPELPNESVNDNTNALKYWNDKLREGLYGDGFQIGMVHALKKSHPPRLRGPALGGNLSGGDRFRRRGFF